MGTWGTGLFSDDTALDVKGDWGELYTRFGEPEATTRELLKIYDADDEDVGPVVILALAVCQWKYGCLLPEIKARAMDVIRNGAGLHMWEDAKNLIKRKAVYAQIGKDLDRPQPPRKRIKKLIPLEVTPYKRGQLLKYRCWDGEYVLLWVRGEYRYKGDVLPLCAAFDWKGPTLPSRREILSLRPILHSNDAGTKEWLRECARESGERLPPEPKGLDWTGFAPREASSYGFDSSRVEIVTGDWTWKLRETGHGPQIPRWIEVGPCIASELSETHAFLKSLGRVDRRYVESVALPVHPRALAPRDSSPQPLGFDIPLLKGRAQKGSLLLVLKRTKHQPVPGDIFVVNMKGKRWVVGRVILADAHFVGGPADVLVYFYKQSFRTTGDIVLPMHLDDLALEPRATSRFHWERGEFLHITNVPLHPCELPVRHIFGPNTSGYYHDAYGLPTTPPAKDELVGSTWRGGIDSDLAEAFGID